MAERVCPVWMGYLLASPLRRLFQKPERILGPYVRQGMTVLDIGCAMGFFSLPMARMVGPDGRVLCVDMQERMLRVLEGRAAKHKLGGVVETRLCRKQGLGLDDLRGRVDFALACYVVHEVPDVSGFFDEVRALLKAGGHLFVLEPKGHVSRRAFETMLEEARTRGLRSVAQPVVMRSRTALLERVED